MIDKGSFVSVIIPNYNHARFLGERIQSVLNQTYQNFEVIILDDKSTDNSVEVINKYKDNPHVSQIVINEENSGSPFKQWHKGFELAKGEWIWIAESDDSCSPEFLETMVQNVDENISYAFCRSQRIDAKGNVLEDHWQDVLKDSFYMDGRDFLNMYLLKNNVVWNASSVLFSRYRAMQIPTEYMDFKGSGDWLFWISLSLTGSIAFVDTTLNCFRYHGNNTTQKLFQNGNNHLEKIRIHTFLVDNRVISKKEYNRIRKADINRSCLYNIYNKEMVNEIMGLWNVTFVEKCMIRLKRLYIRMKQ